MPLCPPTPSLGHEQVNESGRVELLAAVHGYRRMVRRKVPTFVQAQGVHFFFFPRPAFSTVCALSSLTGRRLKGHVRERRRLGSGEGGDVLWMIGEMLWYFGNWCKKRDSYWEKVKIRKNKVKNSYIQINLPCNIPRKFGYAAVSLSR